MDPFEPPPPGLSGLERLRALIASGQRPPINQTLDFALVEVEPGRAVIEATPAAHAYSFLGMVHGGYTATLLDSACGCAVHSQLGAAQRFATLELKIAYHRSIRAETGRVRAEGRVLSFGRRAAFAEASLTDAAGVLLASATSTLLIMGD